MTAENARDFALSDAPRAWKVEAPAERTLCRALTAAIVLLLGLQLHLSLAMAVNWDEFHFLSQVHEYGRGELSQAVNTFHVHLFRWLPLVPGGEVNQIVAARLLMLVLEAGTVLAIVTTAERFMPRWAALAGAVVFLSNSNVLLYAPSFRTDPIGTSLLMSALCLLVCSPLRRGQVVAVAMMVALAGLVTIKSVFYLPGLAVVAWWRWSTAADPRRLLHSYLLAGSASAVAFLGLFWLHGQGLASVTSSVETTSSAYTKMLGTGILFPEWLELRRNLVANYLQWAALLASLAIAVAGAFRAGEDRARWIVLGALALPIATLAFYKNAFPYYYGFMLAPAGVVAGLVFAARLKSPRLVAGILAAMVISAGIHYGRYIGHDQGVQRAVVETVHRMFPDPVPYVEKADMIASFPEVGVHMTTWGMENYRQAGRPVLSTAAPERRPVFVIVGNIVYKWAFRGEERDNPEAFLPQDADFLRENFIPHWGPIWVAGKRAHLDGGETRLQIGVPGPYTLEAARAVTIDGAAVAPNQSITLEAGDHVVVGEGDMTLRWGRNIYRPSGPVPDGQIYWPF